MSELTAIRPALRTALVSTVVTSVLPTGSSTSITVTSGASTTYARGSYVQLTSSGVLTNHALVSIVAFVFPPGAPASMDGELDVASGAAGAEVVLGTLAIPFLQIGAAGGGMPTPWTYIPGIRIPANERLAIRIGVSSTTANSFSVTGSFAPRPY